LQIHSKIGSDFFLRLSMQLRTISGTSLKTNYFFIANAVPHGQNLAASLAARRWGRHDYLASEISPGNKFLLSFGLAEWILWSDIAKASSFGGRVSKHRPKQRATTP
jgi:hypothetical protein